MFLLVYSIVVTLLLVGVIAFSLRLGVRRGGELREYETFYQNTIADVEGIIAMTDKLMRRPFISDDQDVQNVHRVMAIFHDTLLGYINAKQRTAPPEEEERK